MAKSKRNQNPTKPLSTVQTTHSNSINAGTHQQASTVETRLAVPAAPGEDAGVCIVCEDECTCGAAAVAASKATTTLLTTKKRLILKIPNLQKESVNGAGGDVGPIQTASFSPTGPHFDSSSRANSKKGGRPSRAGLQMRQAAARAVLPSSIDARRAGSSPKNKFNVTSANILPSARLSADDFPLNCSSTGLPTFVPASVFGSDSSLSSPSSESDDTSSSSGRSSEDGDTDSEIGAEEERLIVQETLAMQKLRARRELLDNTRLENDESGRRRWDKMNWNDRERHGSVGARSDSDTSSSGGSDSGSSGDDEHDDDDDGEGEDENDDAELDISSAPGFEWSDYDDDFDADLFFANLSDSSIDSSDSDSELEQIHDPTAATSHPCGGVPLQQVVGASYPSSTPLPLVVTENWDGQLVFANGMKDGEDMMDIIFGGAVLKNDAVPTTEADSVHEAEEQDTQDADSNEYGYDCGGSSEPDDGETTDEDELHPELGPILFANSPFNPTPKPHARLHRPALLPVNYRVPRRPQAKNLSAKGMTSPALSTSSSSQMSEPHKLIPAMGSFTISGGLGLGISSAIIDGSRSELLPSPYPPQRRKRRVIQQNDSTVRSPKRVRHSSQPRTPTPLRPSPTASLDPKAGSGEPESSAPEDARATPQRSPPPIDLRDVLHVAVLDDQLFDEHANASATGPSEIKSMRNRWERIPINAFHHRLRSVVRDHRSVNATVNVGGPSSAFALPALSTSVSPKPADGFSYGATTSTVGPYAKYWTVWDSHSSHTSPRQAKRRRSAAERHSRRNSAMSIAKDELRRGSPTERGRQEMLVSPVILPVTEDGAGGNGVLGDGKGSKLPARSFTTSHQSLISRRPFIASDSGPLVAPLMSPTPLSLDG